MKKIKVNYVQIQSGEEVNTFDGWIYLNEEWQFEKAELPEHSFSELEMFSDDYIAQDIKDLIKYPDGKEDISNGLVIYWTAIAQHPFYQTYRTVMLPKCKNWELGYWNLIREIYYVSKDFMYDLESPRRLHYLLDVLDKTFVCENRIMEDSLLKSVKALTDKMGWIPYDDRAFFITELINIIDSGIEYAKSSGTSLSWNKG